jgi:hypothetical protein
MSSLTNALPKSHDFISPPVASSKGHVSPLPMTFNFTLAHYQGRKSNVNRSFFFEERNVTIDVMNDSLLCLFPLISNSSRGV